MWLHRINQQKQQCVNLMKLLRYAKKNAYPNVERIVTRKFIKECKKLQMLEKAAALT